MTASAASVRNGESPRIARNTLFNLVGLGAPLLAALITIPPIIGALGPGRFGVLGLVWVSVAYLNLLDLGLGRATTRYAATLLASKEEESLLGVVGVAVLWQTGIGALGGGVVAVLAAPLVERFLDLPPALAHEAYWSFVMLAAGAPAMAATSSFRGLLEAAQRFGVVNALRIPISTANFIVPLIGAYAGWSLQSMVAGMVVVRVAALAGYASACLRAWPSLRGRVRIDRAKSRELLRFGMWVTLSSAVSAVLVYADRFIVGAVASADSLGYYTVPHEMVTRLDILPTSLVLTLFPALAALSIAAPGGERDAHLKRRRALITRSVEALLALVVPLFIVLAVFGHDALSIWLGVPFAERAATSLRILAAGMAMNVLAFVPFAAIHAAGRPDVTARIHLVELPVHLVLAWVLASRWGIAGAAVAWAVRAGLDAVLLYVAMSRIGITGGRAGDPTRVPALLAGLAAFIGTAAVLSYAVDRPVTAILASVPLLLTWLAIVWRLWLSESEKGRLRAAVGAGS